MSRETVTTSPFDDVLLCTDDGDDYSSNWFITDLILSLGSVMSSLSWFVFCPFWSFVGLDVHFQANQYCTRTLFGGHFYDPHATFVLFCLSFWFLRDEVTVLHLNSSSYLLRLMCTSLSFPSCLMAFVLSSLLFHFPWSCQLCCATHEQTHISPTLK